MPRILKKAEPIISPDAPISRKAEPKVHVSLQLPHSLIIRLEAVARKEKTQRNIFLEKLLDQGLRKKCKIRPVSI